MRRKNIKGKCRICGKIGPLTYEHVPPRKTFNSNKAFIHMGEEILKQDALGFPWELPKLKGKQLQRGIGGYTLCGKCNNDTGAYYGDAFVDFIRKGYRETHNKKYINNSWATITLDEIYPLRIIKQIIYTFGYMQRLKSKKIVRKELSITQENSKYEKPGNIQLLCGKVSNHTM